MSQLRVDRQTPGELPEAAVWHARQAFLSRHPFHRTGSSFVKSQFEGPALAGLAKTWAKPQPRSLAPIPRLVFQPRIVQK